MKEELVEIKFFLLPIYRNRLSDFWGIRESICFVKGIFTWSIKIAVKVWLFTQINLEQISLDKFAWAYTQNFENYSNRNTLENELAT